MMCHRDGRGRRRVTFESAARPAGPGGAQAADAAAGESKPEAAAHRSWHPVWLGTQADRQSRCECGGSSDGHGAHGRSGGSSPA